MASLTKTASDAAIVARWKGKLKFREGMLSFARRQVAYWTVQRAKAKTIVRLGLATRMLQEREAKVRLREGQVSDARKVIARHSRPNLRERAFAEAVKDLGVRESGGNNRGPAVEKIIREAGGQVGESWCGDAVFAWYKRAGSKAPVRNWAAVRLLAKLITKVKNPARGHIVIYQWDGGDPDHTGLFDQWINRTTGDFWAVEGNTGTDGSVSDGNGADGVRRRRRNTRQVEMFGRVLR